ncbi:hypothetical protein [Deinococcus murrayi]|uniref:hypothetical protein n=1 Tax=Deinococcus murrayi TaxID=68910 RepID=UPI000488A78B|nr:hypothetical protein [Deinococcus murrayi]
MRAIVTDLHERLTAAGLHVLLPEERERPLAGRKPGQAGGLEAYLRQHPQGYVQLEEAQGITDDGVTAVYWVPVAAIAPTAADDDALAAQVRRVLCGSPRDPGPYLPRLPDSPRAIADGVYLCRPSYECLAVDGTLAV